MSTRVAAPPYPVPSMKRTLLILSAVLFAALVGVRLYQEWPQAEAAGAGMPRGGFARTVGAAPAELGSVSQSVTLVGSLRALETVQVSPRLGGRLEEIFVQVGDRVRQGQVIARLDDAELSEQVQQSEASLEVSGAVVRQRELELENLGAVLERTKGLRDSGLISDEQLEQAQTRYDVAQAQLNVARAQYQQAEASLRQLRIRLEQTQITSPIDGLIGRRFVDAGVQLNTANPLVTVVNIDTVKLVANVAERDLVKLQEGAIGEVEVDALPGRIYDGQVANVSPLLDSQTRTAEVEILIPNEDGQLRAEMFARVNLELAAKDNVLRVPRQALVVRGETQGVYRIDEESRAQFQPIQIGLAEANWVEVTAGLSAGDTVITLGSNLLKDGDVVRVAGERPTSPEASA
jgi:RND family efflux transporter MFP subunit